MFRDLEFDIFYGKRMGGPPRGGDVKTGFTPEVTPRKSGVVGTWLHLMWCALVCMLSGPIFRGWSEEEIKTCHKV